MNSRLPEIRICLLLPLSYELNMRVVPQIGICSYLTHFGHQVTWVIGSAETRQTKQFMLGDVLVYAAPRMKYIAPFFKRLPASRAAYILAESLNRIPDTLRRVRIVLKIFNEGKYNMVFVREWDLFDGLVAAYIKRKYKIPFVFELVNPLEQVWEDHRIEPKAPTFLYYPLAKFRALMKVYIMKKADLVLTTTRWFEDNLAEKGIPKSKLMAYPNGVDPEHFTNREGHSIREKYQLGSAKVIIYIGTMRKARCLDVLIYSYSRVKHLMGNVRLLIVGEGSDEENVKRLAIKLGISDDVIFTGQVAQSAIPGFIDAADIAVSPVPPTSYFVVSSPIKIFEYMAMAKPVVANEEIHEHREVIEQSGGGILVPFTAEAFGNAIIELLDNPERTAQMGRKGKEWVMKNRSYEVLARLLEERCLELLGNVTHADVHHGLRDGIHA